MPAAASGQMSASGIRTPADPTGGNVMSQNQGSAVEHGEIETRLRELLAKQSEVSVDVSAVDSTTKIEDIGFDSVSILDFMYEIESELDVDLEVRDLVTLETVGDLVEHLATKLRAKLDG